MQPFSRRFEEDLFRDLSERELADLGAQIAFQTVQAGTLLYAPQQPAAMVFLLQEGRVHLFHHPCSGKALTLAIVNPRTIFGEIALLGLPTYEQFAVALDRCVVGTMHHDAARQLLFGDPRIAARLAEMLGRRLNALERRLRDIICKTVPQRVADTLLAFSRTAPIDLHSSLGSCEVWITHEQLAGLVGSHRETVTKALDELCRQGLIELKRGRIVLRDIPALVAHSED